MSLDSEKAHLHSWRDSGSSESTPADKRNILYQALEQIRQNKATCYKNLKEQTGHDFNTEDYSTIIAYLDTQLGRYYWMKDSDELLHALLEELDNELECARRLFPQITDDEVQAINAERKRIDDIEISTRGRIRW